ncbi:hypothetical protein [Neptunomonas japonica]|uniref:hypothetical protein n=1 Tax=Neptunomonas japonica TaxID=417574 RepID=UPI0004244860|nr:hypothetical protein [Neptunomonas japonica]
MASKKMLSVDETWYFKEYVIKLLDPYSKSYNKWFDLRGKIELKECLSKLIDALCSGQVKLATF